MRLVQENRKDQGAVGDRVVIQGGQRCARQPSVDRPGAGQEPEMARLGCCAGSLECVVELEAALALPFPQGNPPHL